MKVFLDANILFSASDSGSATRELLDLVTDRGEAVTSPHAWEEARRNLEIKRPQHRDGLDELSARVGITHAFRMPANVELTAKDTPILAGAVGARCTHLWTSDATHFGALYGRTVAGVTVVSSVLLLEELARGS